MHARQPFLQVKVKVWSWPVSTFGMLPMRDALLQEEHVADGPTGLSFSPCLYLHGVQGFTERMPISPMLSSVGSAHLQSGMPSDAVAGAEAMWQLSNHLNSLQLQQAPLSGAAPCFFRSPSAACWPLLLR